MVFLSKEIVKFANTITAITDIDITTAGSSFAVTARAEHIPKTCTVMGFSALSGLKISFLFFGENRGSFNFNSSAIIIFVF
jgi:hypothetical protein